MGCVEEFVGAYNQTGSVDGTGAAARFSGISGITGDGDDTLWVADANTVRKIAISTATVTTLPGTYGHLRGIVYVSGVTPFLLVSDATHYVIRRIDPSAPSNATVFSGMLDKPGTTDGNNTTTYTSPGALAWVAGSGRYFVLDGSSVRYFFNAGGASTIAIGTSPADLKNPAGILAQPIMNGAIYSAVVAESGGNDLRSFEAPSGPVTPWGPGPDCGSGQAAYKDGVCASAQFDGVSGLAQLDATTLFAADPLNNRVRRVAWPTDVTTVAGDGVAGHVVGVRQAARLHAPTALYFRANAQKDLFIVDAAGTEIRKESFP
jgi:hypothetical protein